MAKFTDPQGREWSIDITAGDLERIKRDTGVDLRDALRPDGGKLTECLDDNDQFLDLMWCLCGRQATIPRDQFECLFDRDTIVSAVAAVWESVWDFSRGQRAGAEARKALLAAGEEVEKMTVEILQKATEHIKAGLISNATASDSAESPALIIEPSPSAN